MHAFLIVVTCIVANAMSAPYVPEKTNRVNLNFNTGWKFYRGDASGADAASFVDAGWEQVCLPHTVRLEKRQTSGNQNYQGFAWYRRHFYIDNSYNGRKIFIEFEAAMQVAEVWVNDTKKTTHQGGYLPFTIDITDVARYGAAENVISVRVNNSNNNNVPPGTNQANLDFCYFGGIYRDVYMHITDKLHVTDAVYANKVAGGGVFVTYANVSTASAQVTIKTDVFNENTTARNCKIKSEIVDTSNQVVGTKIDSMSITSQKDTAFSQSMTVTNPHLWHPDHPYRYTLHSTIYDGATPVDSCRTRIGIRWIEFGTFGLRINGQVTRAGGANRHQEYIYIGNAMPNSLTRRDVIKMKQGGWNSVRCAHYPQGPSFMDACDDFGIVAIGCDAGWQYYNSSTQFTQNCYQNERDMVRWQRNHPSLILWEAQLNESSYPDSFGIRLHRIIHEEQPGNQTFCASDANWNGGPAVSFANLFEVNFVEINGTGRGTTGGQWIRELGDDWTEQNDVNKHGRRCHRGVNGALNGFYYGGEAAMLNSANLVFSSYVNGLDQTKYAGCGVWAAFDNNRGFSPHLGAVGAMDLFRLPKFNYYQFMSQRDPNLVIPGATMGPMVFIANYWTQPSPRNVDVYSNCEQVKLYLNGTLVGTQTPTVTTFRSKVVFSNVAWQTGTLRADGLIGGAVRATYSVSTPLTPDHLELVADKCGIDLVADGSDIMAVYAYVKDANGTVMPTDSSLITFTVSGEGKILGDGDARVGANPVKAEAGIFGCLIQSTRIAGTITVTARSGTLNPGSVSFQSLPMTDPIVPERPTTAIIKQPSPRALISSLRTPTGYIVLIDCAGKVVAKKSVSRENYTQLAKSGSPKLWQLSTGCSVNRGVYFAEYMSRDGSEKKIKRMLLIR
jgi:beta-galactosidase